MTGHQHSHQHRNRRSIRHSLEPLPDPDLICRRCKIPGRQHHRILCPSLLTILDHRHGIVDILRRRARNNGPVLVARIVEGFALALDQVVALVGLQEDGFAGAAEDYEAFDAAADEEEGVRGLRFGVDGWGGGVVGGAAFGDEEGWDRDLGGWLGSATVAGVSGTYVDPLRRWCGHLRSIRKRHPFGE